MPNYIYMGHGADIITNGEYDKRLVPVGRNYLTIAKTGLTSRLESVMNLIKINLTPEGKTYLDDPETYYNKLSILVAGYDKAVADPVLSMNDLHLTTSGELFINNHCDFIFSFGSGPIKYLYKSGLYDMSKVMTSYLPIYKQNAFKPGFNHEFQHKFVIDTRVGIDFKTIKSVYKDSVFPTSKEIIKELKNVMGLPSSAPIRQSSAPTRQSSAPTRQSSAPTRRSRPSATRSSSVNRLSFKSKRNSSFNGNLDSTVVPYALFVSSVKKIIDKDKDTGFSLMEKFPGNHYNFVCRTLTADYPINRMLLHRAQSNNRANRNRNEYIAHKLANPILNFRLFLEEFLSDETRLTFGRVRSNRTYESNVSHAIFLFDEYLKKGIRKSALIITFDNFIDDLNTYIEAGFFTMNEIPYDIISRLRAIIGGEPPIVGGEPYFFHTLIV
jgi:hypothetical protein